MKIENVHERRLDARPDAVAYIEALLDRVEEALCMCVEETPHE